MDHCFKFIFGELNSSVISKTDLFRGSNLMHKEIRKENLNNVQKSQEIFVVEQNNKQSTQKIKREFAITNKEWIPDSAKPSYHNQRLAQSKWAFCLSFLGCLLGSIMIIMGMCKSINSSNVEWIFITTGIVLEAVAVLFFYLNNKANDKISEFFKELIVDADKKDAQNLIQKIENSDIRDEVIVKLALHLSGIDDEKTCK